MPLKTPFFMHVLRCSRTNTFNQRTIERYLTLMCELSSACRLKFSVGEQ